jgi:hypothetical protein
VSSCWPSADARGTATAVVVAGVARRCSEPEPAPSEGCGAMVAMPAFHSCALQYGLPCSSLHLWDRRLQKKGMAWAHVQRVRNRAARGTGVLHD